MLKYSNNTTGCFSLIMNFKTFFTKNLMVITIVFPLFIVLFYGVSISLSLKYKHHQYSNNELNRYELELKEKHRAFFEEKAKYIDSFMKFLYLQGIDQSSLNFTARILLFIDSLKAYESGFIFIFKQDGTVLKHPCAERLIELVSTHENILHQSQEDQILYKLLHAAEQNEFVNYRGTDCVSQTLIDKIAYVHHVKTTDIYIVISKNEKDIAESIAMKKRILETKMEDEQSEIIKIFLVFGLLSIIFSLLFSKVLNVLIRDYESEVSKSHEAMFSQSRLAQAGELLSMISHQWRQPISKISSVASDLRFKIMTGNHIETQVLDTKLYEIEEYTEFLSDTIDDFREFYKPKKKKEASYVLPLIEKSLRFLDNEIRKKSITIEERWDQDIQLKLYENELMQVVINIVQNAIEFSEKGALIYLSSQLKENEYIISIKDNAGGIKPEHIHKIFDAHFSTKSNTNTSNLGLGLYVSKVIIEKHFQGKLEVHSEGQSTTFIIRLVRDDK